MGASGSSMDPLRLQGHVIPFDDTFIEGNLTFTSQRLVNLAGFNPTAAMIDWQSNFLWSRLEIGTVKISSVFHVEGQFEYLRRRKKRLFEGRFSKGGGSGSGSGSFDHKMDNNIEIHGLSTMNYHDVEIDVNAQLALNKDG